MLDAFESTGAGAVGVVDEGEVIFSRALGHLPRVLAPDRPVAPVDIVLAHAGADARLLDASRETAAGVVVAALGRGNVPPAMFEGVVRWREADKPVVISSRAHHGRVGPTYGYPGAGRRLQEIGAILAGGRRPHQARVDLMLALGLGLRGDALAEVFAG